MEITTIAYHSSEKYRFSIVGSLPGTEREHKVYVLTFQDDLRKLMTAIPVPQQDPDTVAREFVLNIILKIGDPKQILTNQGANF